MVFLLCDTSTDHVRPLKLAPFKCYNILRIRHVANFDKAEALAQAERPAVAVRVPHQPHLVRLHVGVQSNNVLDVTLA